MSGVVPIMYGYNDASRPPLTRFFGHHLGDYDGGVRDNTYYPLSFNREHWDYDYEGGRDSIWHRRTDGDLENNYISQVHDQTRDNLAWHMNRDVEYHSNNCDPGRPAAINGVAFNWQWSEAPYNWNSARVKPRRAPVIIDPSSAMQDYTGDGEIQDMGSNKGIYERGQRDLYMQIDRNEVMRTTAPVGEIAYETQWVTNPVQWAPDRTLRVLRDPTQIYHPSQWNVVDI